MLLKIDLWVLARMVKAIHYADRYFAKAGRHRAPA